MLKGLIFNSIFNLSRLIPLRTIKSITSKIPLGFNYHAVSNQSLPHLKGITRYSSIGEFERHVVFLKENFRILPYPEIRDYVLHGKSLPENPAFVTFDDGLSQCFSEVRPILLKHEIPCIFFITTGLIGNKRLFYRHLASLCIGIVNNIDEPVDMLTEIGRRTGEKIKSIKDFSKWARSVKFDEQDKLYKAAESLGLDTNEFLTKERPYLSSDEIVQLKRDNFSIGAHGIDHLDMKHATADEIRREIAGSCEFICNLAGETSVPFAFPFTSAGIEPALLDEILQNPAVDMFFDNRGIGFNGLPLNRMHVDSHCGKFDPDRFIKYLVLYNLLRQRFFTL